LEKKLVIPVDEAISGPLHGGAGTFRILVDNEICGAEKMSLLVNTAKAGAIGKAHTHEQEHCWYILSGTATMYIGDKIFKIGPNMAVFTPPDTLHKMVVDQELDMTYIVIYAPPGPEQKLKSKGVNAFEDTAGEIK